MVRPSVLNHYPVLVLLVFSAGCAMPHARGGPKFVAAVRRVAGVGRPTLPHLRMRL